MMTIKKILCPTDFSEPSLQGLDCAIELAGLFKSELCLLHVVAVLPAQPSDPNFAFEVPEFERIIHKESEVKLGGLIKDRVPASIKARGIIGHGSPAKEIVRIADEEEHADLIVIATQGSTGWHHLVMGSVAEKVIRHAHCPIFVIRETRK